MWKFELWAYDICYVYLLGATIDNLIRKTKQFFSTFFARDHDMKGAMLCRCILQVRFKYELHFFDIVTRTYVLVFLCLPNGDKSIGLTSSEQALKSSTLVSPEYSVLQKFKEIEIFLIVAVLEKE